MRRRRLVVSLSLAGPAVAALGFLLGPSHHGPADARLVTGQGASELTTATKVHLSGRPENPAIDQATTGRSGRADQFRVTVSDVQGMFPGSHQPLRVLFTNGHPFDIWVTEVTVSAQDTRRCLAEHLVTGTYQLRARTHVPGRSHAAGEIPFGMRASAPNGCQGVSFDLEVGAKAVKR